MFPKSYDVSNIYPSGASAIPPETSPVPSEKEKPQQGMLRFNAFKAAAIIAFLDPKNIVRASKIALYAVAALVVMVVKPLFEAIGCSKIAASLNETIQILKVIGTHEATKMVHVLGRFTFGNDLLVETRNVGNIEDLKTKQAEIKSKLNEIKTEFLDELENKNIRKTYLLDDASKQRFVECNFDTVVTEGVCMGTSMYIINQYLTGKTKKKQDFASDDLVEISKTCSQGVPVDAIVNHAIYLGTQFGSTISQEYAARGLGISEDELTQANPQEILLAKFNDLKPVKGLTKEETVQQGLGIPSHEDFVNSFEHLDKGGFRELTEGAYQLSFATGDGAHAIVYIKDPKGSFLFDPNFGLINCHDDPQTAVLKLLSLYPPPNTGNEDNYRIELTKYALAEKAQIDPIILDVNPAPIPFL